MHRATSPFSVAILKGFSEKKQRKIILRELCIALFVVILFALAGQELLTFLKIKQYTIQVSGGIYSVSYRLEDDISCRQRPSTTTGGQGAVYPYQWQCPW
jgi:hypothetical protein